MAVCNNAACSSPTLTTVDSVGEVGKNPSLALNSDGYPVVSYYDGSPNVNLKVAVFESSIATPPTPTPSPMPTVTPSPTAFDQAIY